MLERYFNVSGLKMQVGAVVDIRSTRTEHPKVVKRYYNQERFRNVCQCLQRADLDMPQVRVLFDSVVPLTAVYVIAGAARENVINDEKFYVAEKKALKAFENRQRRSASNRTTTMLIVYYTWESSCASVGDFRPDTMISLSIFLRRQTRFRDCYLSGS
ncbi:LOW QUALITY PROTEIN: hypothetical protein PHMEG_00031792 [Phytophthora megakarya]|uniref:Uncharacterized protein n=1 Tax=Phytophthora megakarya TaxID=4795 RepID=A0A225UXB5_9STRA|nr:LOW QUALITY PROTEIN: hypothetical protein PHMEG_00031792 [Phytophthora megakarya]